MVRRRSLVVGTAAAAGCALAGCIGRSAAPLRFWAMGNEGLVAQTLLEGFRRERPDVPVAIEQLPWTAAHEKLLTAYAGDATPDVAQLGNTWLPEFVALGALAPLDERVAAARLPVADYFSGIWDTNRVDGRLWGLPWYVDTRLFYYRADLLAQAGHAAPATTWPGWLAQLRDIKRLVGPDRYAVLLPVNEYEPLLALALQQDEPLLRDGGRYGNFRGEGFRRTLDYYLGLFREQLAPPSSSTQISNVWSEFARGYFSFYISGPWNLAEFAQRLPPALKDAWRTAPLPGPAGPGASIAGGASLAVFANSRRRDDAWALVEYLARDAVQARFRELTGNLPPRRSAWAVPALAGDARSRAFGEQLERVKPVPQVPEWERIATEMRLLAEQAVLGRLPAAELPAELDRRADAMLEKRRWMLDHRRAA